MRWEAVSPLSSYIREKRRFVRVIHQTRCWTGAKRKLKDFRRIATRYDKIADDFLAMVKFASMRLWLHAYESTA